jgi:alkyldihydroxyacetonephosphate synthase
MLSGHCPIQQSDGASLPSDIAKTVAEILKQSGFSTVQMTIDSQSRSRHGTGHALEDMYNLRSGKMHRVPDVVVWPTDEVDCVKLVDVAAKHSLCLVPFGGGTNVTRATWCPSFDVDPRPMVSVDMRRMNKIIWINKEDGLAHIEAGMVGRDMCTELAKHGLTVGHEPDSIEFSTLGGWVATRASGMKRNRYGNIEDIVREVRLVTSTGIM